MKMVRGIYQGKSRTISLGLHTIYVKSAHKDSFVKLNRQKFWPNQRCHVMELNVCLNSRRTFTHINERKINVSRIKYALASQLMTIS